MAKKHSISSFGCSSPILLGVFGLPVICACGKCYWCLEQSRKGSKELAFKRHIIVTERFDNGKSVDDLPF